MRAPAHLQHGEHAPELPFHLHVALEDEVVGEEGDLVRAEAEIGERLEHLDGHHHGDPGGGERGDGPVERLAKVLAKRGRDRQLEARERVDDHALRLRLFHQREDGVQRLVDGEIDRAQIEHLDAALVHHRREIEARAVGSRQVALRLLLEDGDDAGLAPGHPRGDEMRAEQRLAGARRPGDQDRVADEEAPVQHAVELGDPEVIRVIGGLVVLPTRGTGIRGKTSIPSWEMRKVWSPAIGLCPRTLITWSLRTTELRSTAWLSQTIPSATTKSGLVVISLSEYSPTRNVVTCALVKVTARRCTKPWARGSRECGLRINVRTESMTTMLGRKLSTSRAMASSTASRPLCNASSSRLMKRTTSGILSPSKNENCC